MSLVLFSKTFQTYVMHTSHILEDFGNASPYVCTFLANRLYDLKVTRRFQCAIQNWYESVSAHVPKRVLQFVSENP